MPPNAVDGEVGVFQVTIDRMFVPSRPGAPLKVRATDPTGFVHLVWFGGSAQHIDRLLPRGETRLVSGKVERFNGEVQIVHPDIAALDKAADIPASEPVYPATQGLTSRQLRKLIQAALPAAPDLAEWQDAAWLKKQGWLSWRAALDALHAPAGEPDLSPDAPARQRLAYDEFLAHQLALARRRRAREIKPAPVIGPVRRPTICFRPCPFN